MFLSPRQYFQQQAHRPRKRFGQHFLSDPWTSERIVESAALQPSDVAVEIGPGLGALTQFILPLVRRLHLVELDRDLADYLGRNMPPSDGEVSIHPQDVLTFNFGALGRDVGQRLVVLGNLPYNISSPLVFHLLESLEAVERAVFMVQKEVGERLAAGPGGKEYGVLSVLLGIYGSVTSLFTVPPGQFYPPPKVDSLVLRIDFNGKPPAGAPPFRFLRHMVSAAFQQRRKTLQNTLKGLAEGRMALLQAALAQCDIDPKRRPETLEPKEFLELAIALHHHLRSTERSSE